MRRGLVIVMLAFLAMGATAPIAGAHAVLVGSQPSDGTAIARSPGQLRLRFSEDLSPRFRRVQLLDRRGNAVAGTRIAGGGNARELVITVPRLPRGTYEVVWEVLAEDDGHVTDGALAFGVDTRAPGAARSRGGPGSAGTPAEAALRWLDFAMLAALLGGLAMGMLLVRLAVAPGAARRDVEEPAGSVAARAARPVLSGAAWSGTVALVLGCVLVIREAHALEVPVGTVIGIRWGILWLVREVLLAGLVGTAVLMLRRPSARAGVVCAAAAALAVALAVTRALGAHAAAVESGPAVAAHAVHVLGAAVWAGGILALAVALWAARGEATALARGIWRPFAWTAGLAVLALAVTGLYSAGEQVASVDALLDTFYGRTLLTKTALVLVAGGLGLANAVLLRRAAAPRLLLAEAVVGLEIIVAAAVLTASSPARGPEFAAPEAAPTPLVVREAGDVLVTATARPNRPGANLVTVAAVSSRRPPPAAIDRVLLRFDPGAGTTVALRPLAPGRWTGGVTLAEEGRRRMTVVLERGGQRLSVGFPWTVAPPDPARPVVVSARRLAPLLNGAALGLLLAAALLAAARVARRPSVLRIQPLGKEAP